MKRLYLFVFLCLTVFFASCKKTDDNSIFYTADEIYLNCVEYGHVSSDFPEGLLIFESKEQLERALKEYESIASLAELETITEEYPLGEYIYLMNCMDTEFDSKVECKGLRIDETAMTIHLEHKIKSQKKSDIAAFFDHVGDVTMFHMNPSSGYNLTSILYYPELDYDYFMSIYSNGSERILFRCFVDTSEEVYVPEEDAVSTLDIGDKTVALYEIEDEAAYAFVGRTETANSLITIMISEGDEETIRNTIEGHIVSATLLELVEDTKKR